jgi:hypothetical protein
MYKKIPTYKVAKDEWTYTFFKTKEEYRSFVEGLFKEPGLYNFDETSAGFNSHAQFYNKNKYLLLLQKEVLIIYTTGIQKKKSVEME